MFEESASLINKAYEEYSNVELLCSYKIIRNILVVNGKKEFVKAYTKNGFIYPLTNQEAKRIEFKYNIPNILEAPIKKEEYIWQLLVL